MDGSPPGLYFSRDLSSEIGVNLSKESSFHQRRIGKAERRCTLSMPKQAERGLEYPLEMNKYALTNGEFLLTRSPVVGKVSRKKTNKKKV